MRNILVRTLIIVGFIAAVAATSMPGAASGLQLDAFVQPRVEWNNHIEFGISVDPATVPESRASAQLQGARFILRARLSASHDSDRFAFRLALDPAVGEYDGEDGFLDQFSARVVPSTLRLSYKPSRDVPPITVDLGATRLERNSPIYDYWQSSIGLRFGEALAYEYSERRFDDTMPREDYLLIGSARHQLRTQGQVRIGRDLRADVSLQHQSETYDTNLSPLLYSAILVSRDFVRRDSRQRANGSLSKVLTQSSLVRVGADVLANDSTASFYRFRSAEAHVLAFHSSQDGSWMRGRISRTWVWFSDREVGERFTHNRMKRSDSQWRVVVDGERRIAANVTATASAELIRNHTNDPRSLFDFLNYTQRIWSIGVSAGF